MARVLVREGALRPAFFDHLAQPLLATSAAEVQRKRPNANVPEHVPGVTPVRQETVDARGQKPKRERLEPEGDGMVHQRLGPVGARAAFAVPLD